MKYNKKVIIGGTLGAIGVTVAVVTPVVILKNKDNDSSDKDDINKTLKKFKDNDSKKIKTELKVAIGSKEKGDEVTSKELGYKEPKLEKGIIATYKIKTPYNEDNGKVVVTIILKKNKTTKIDNITITAITKEQRHLENVAKQIDSEIESSKNEIAFKKTMSSKVKNDSVAYEELGILKLTLKEDVTATYIVKIPYNDTKKSVVITITLKQKNAVVEKEVKIWEKEAYKVRKEEVQKLLNTEQTRVNDLTSNEKVEITFDDVIANVATKFTKEIATMLKINLIPNDKFTYTYISTIKGIKVTVKSKAMYSLTAENVVESIGITFKKVTIDTSKLVVKSFAITKTNGLGTIDLISGVALPKGVEAKYFRGSEASENDGDYLTTITDLANGNKVFVKFFVKDDNKDTHMLPTSDFTNLISIVVSDLKTLIYKDDLIVESLVVEGLNGNAGIKFRGGVILPNEVEAKYYRGSEAPESDSDYSTTPTDLTNNEKVFVKFFVKDEFKNTHMLPTNRFTNPIEITIVGLKTLINTTRLAKISFIIVRGDGWGTFQLRRRNDFLPNEVEARYYKGNEAPKSDSDYSRTPIDLARSDKVFVKFFVKDEFKNTHMLPNLVKVTVKSIESLSKHVSSVDAITRTRMLSSIGEFTNPIGEFTNPIEIIVESLIEN